MARAFSKQAHTERSLLLAPRCCQVLPAVVTWLPTLGERATYVRAFTWAMSERAQQMGVMIALGTDPVTWYRLCTACPNIIPRGEAGWRHYY
jgi:hypothetical protein